jgi:hypothetical protein
MTLHSMTPRTTARKTPRSASKPSSRKQEAAPEIVLHGMQPAGRSANQAAKRISARITLDAQGNYSVSDQASR